MPTFLRILRLYPLALWAGGEVFFILVAGIAFTVLPDAHMAGLVVRSALINLHRIGMCGGAIYLLATLALMAFDTEKNRTRLIETAIVIVMLILTAYSQFSIIPHMETDRLNLGGDVATATADNPAKHDFDRLHSLSVDLEAAVLIGSFVLLALAPLDRRSRPAS